MNKRPSKRPRVEHVTNNITNYNNIHNYFGPAPPAAAPAAPPPERWLPAPPPRGRLSQNMGGGLRITCSNKGGGCGSKTHGPSQFVPEQNPRDKKAYLDAIDAL